MQSFLLLVSCSCGKVTSDQLHMYIFDVPMLDVRADSCGSFINDGDISYSDESDGVEDGGDSESHHASGVSRPSTTAKKR